MFCTLARLLQLSTAQAWSRLYHIKYFFVSVKIFLYSVFFYVSPFQQGVSLLVPPLYTPSISSLPCSGLKILNALSLWNILLLTVTAFTLHACLCAVFV